MAEGLRVGERVVKPRGLPTFRDPRTVVEVIDPEHVRVERVLVVLRQSELDRVGQSPQHEAIRGSSQPTPATPDFTSGMRVQICSSELACSIAIIVQVLSGGSALRILEETPDGPRTRDISARLVKPLD